MKNIIYFLAIILSLSGFAQPFPAGGYQGGMHGNRLPVHTIEILEGWSGISSYINPQYPDVVGLTSGISNELVIIYNQQGAYWPAIPMNTFGDWKSHSGCIIKVLDDCSMEMKGYEESDTEVDLPEGWTLIPVLSKAPVLATDIFAGLTDLEVVKGIGQNNACYWPRFGINQLVFLKPGVSYYGRMNADGSIDYGGTGSLKTAVDFANVYPESSPWNEVKSSPFSHTIAFIDRATEHLESGDLIGVFTSSGTCAGLIELTDDEAPLAIQSFGDDPLTDHADGFISDELLGYKMYRPSSETYFKLIPEYDLSYDPGIFREHGLSVIFDLKMEAVGISEPGTEKIRIFPNPSTGIFNIEGITGASSIVISNAFGVEILSMQINADTQLDLSSQPSGIYIIRISSKVGVYFEKLVIN